FFSRKPFMSFVLIILILAIVVANPEIMLFTFAFGYSLSGPVWLLYRLMKKVVVDMRSKKSQCEDHLVSRRGERKHPIRDRGTGYEKLSCCGGRCHGGRGQ
ncbi:MAG: hypothetical protein LLG93_15185, partial [Deltaproteobacteria bacterium]|nr:hypothetical protein [Deltaproteobacteria bacterium]